MSTAKTGIAALLAVAFLFAGATCAFAETDASAFACNPFKHYDGEVGYLICQYLEEGAPHVDVPQTIDGQRVFGTAGGMAAFARTDTSGEIVPRDDIESVRLPEGFLWLGYGAFAQCTALGQIELPETLRTIERRAFEGCTALTQIRVPENVEYIGSGAFAGCTALSSFVCSENAPVISKETFSGCSELRCVYISENVLAIEEDAFAGCPVTTVNYGGSEDSWNAMEIAEGNDALLRADVTFRSRREAPAVSAPPPADPGTQAPDFALAADAVMRINGDSIILSAAENIRAMDVTSQFLDLHSIILDVTDAKRAKKSGADVFATGDVVSFWDEDGSPLTEKTVIVLGDVLGTGELTISQLVRMAAAVSGRAPLQGAYLAAGDLSGNGCIDLTDLVEQVRMLKKA